MAVLVSIDGRQCEAEHATVSVFDRGFLYGDSVFETLRTYDGRVFALDEHLRRLQWSAERVFIELPCSLPELRAEVEDAVRRAGNAESYVRVMITRGSGELGLVPDPSERSRRVVIVGPLKSPPAASYEQGVGAVTYRVQRVTDRTAAAGAKVANYLVRVLAMREVRAARANEALVVDGEGRVVEGATSNLFVVHRGVLRTPGEDAGILPGITREGVLRAAARLGIAVEFETPTLDEVRAADEIMISSSIRELLAVVVLDGRPVGAGSPGPTYRRLLDGFRQLVRAEAPRME